MTDDPWTPLAVLLTWLLFVALFEIGVYRAGRRINDRKDDAA